MLRLLGGCWLKHPHIKSPVSDKESPWEKKTAKVLSGINALTKLRDFDRPNLVGRYAMLIYRAGDGKKLSDPLERATQLIDLILVYESQIKVTAWHSDADAENYGTPSMSQYRRMAWSGVDTQGRPEEWADVHPSHVQILAESSVGDFFEGVPLLRAGFNRLVDLDKIAGVSGESCLKNSARTIEFKYDTNAAVQAVPGPDGKEPPSVREAH